jgi:hypothetical protein
VGIFFGGCGSSSAFRGVFNRVLELPVLRSEAPKKRDKKIDQNNQGRRKKTEGKKPHLLVMSPDDLFKNKLLSCFELPLLSCF